MKNIIVALLVLAALTGNSQTWTHYTRANTSKQLPDKWVNASAQDTDGSMWFGTFKGVSHFDGKKWKNYFKSDGLVDDNVISIAIDKNGVKWFGTTKGISKFDGVKWTSYNYASGLHQEYIPSIAIDAKGSKWFATSGGVLKFNDTTWTTYSQFTTSNELKDDHISVIRIDKQDVKWFATSKGVAKYNDTIWKTYTMNDGLVHDNVVTMEIDAKNNKWFVTNTGVSKFDGTNWFTYNSSNGLPYAYITNMTIDSYDNKWFVSSGQDTMKVTKFDGTNWTTFSTRDGLAHRSVRFISSDKQGNKWIGTHGGLSKYNDTTWTTYNWAKGLEGYPSRMIIDAQDNKWFSNFDSDNKGLGVVKFDDTTWTPYKTENGLMNNSIGPLMEDPYGNKWFGVTDHSGPGGGASKFDGTNWTSYYDSTGLEWLKVYCMASDNKGNKWFGTAFGGLVVFDGTKWKSYTTKDGLLGDIINTIAIDRDNTIWFGSYSGVTKFDGISLTHFTNVINASSIAFDKQGNKWIATSAGVMKYNDTSWTTYTTADGLIDNSVTSIAIDENGTKWFGTYQGVSKFDDKIWTSYTTLDGLPDNGIGDLKIDNKGNKWFITKEGVSKLSDGGPGGSNTRKIQPGIVFNDINGNGKKDKNENSLPGQIIKIDGNYTTTQDDGMFYTSLAKGSHTYTISPPANWKLTTVSSITVTVSDAVIKDTILFGIQAIPGIHSVEIKLNGTATRAGFQSTTWLDLANTGSLVENGTVSHTLSSLTSFIQAMPPADSVIGRRLVWKFNSLLPNEHRQITVISQMPGVNNLGDTLVSTSLVKTPSDQKGDTLRQILTGSYDPNDKLVKQGEGERNYVLFDKELEYSIRFQNSGTDTAFNVNVQDFIDKNLDIASLRILSASHSVKLDIKGQNEVVFRFPDILLPDSIVDKLGSNGYVKYAIKPRKGLAENTAVYNQAFIYFDFNPAIITNQTLNTYVSVIPKPVITGRKSLNDQFKPSLYPNPTSDKLTILLPESGDFEVLISDLQGRVARQWFGITTRETTISLNGLESGMYQYTIKNQNGKKFTGKLVFIK